MNTVKESIKNYKSVQLYELEAPYTLDVTFYRTDMCEDVIELRGDIYERLDARTLRKRIDKIVRYDDLKL